jgi:hypothetical protein
MRLKTSCHTIYARWAFDMVVRTFRVAFPESAQGAKQGDFVTLGFSSVAFMPITTTSI